MKRINIVKTGLMTLAFAGLLGGVAAAGEFSLSGRGPVSRTVKPGTRTLIVDFRNNSEINMGADIIDSAGDRVYGKTLTTKEVVRASVPTLAGRTYKIEMRCNDANPFNREKCRAQAIWVCHKGSKAVSCKALVGL